MVSIPRAALEVILKYTPWFKRNKIPRVTNLWSSAFLIWSIWSFLDEWCYLHLQLLQETTAAWLPSSTWRDQSVFTWFRFLTFHFGRSITFTFAWFRFIFPWTILTQLPTYLIVIPPIQLHTSSFFLFNCIEKTFQIYDCDLPIYSSLQILLANLFCCV